LDEKGLQPLMKILILQETDWIERYPAQQHHLAEMMALKGHTVRVIDHALLWRQQPAKGLVYRRRAFTNITKIHPNAQITIIRPGFIKLPLLDYLSMSISHHNEIQRQIKEFHPDVIIGFGILNSYSAVRAVKRTQIPFIYYWIDALHLLIPARVFRGVGQFIESSTLKKSDQVLTINESLNDLVTRMGAPTRRTRVLRAGINLKAFNPDLRDSATGSGYGLEKTDIVLFFMGFLYRFSGLKEVAVNLAKSSCRQLKLLVVGEGDLLDELQEIQKQYGLQKRLILAGKKKYSEIPAHISVADICLLPAYPEEPIMQDIVPIKLYEYMAMAKPVIATRLPGIFKEFGPDNGIVFVEKPEDVIEQALELMKGEKLKELGVRARRFAERNSWDKIANDFEIILQEAVKEKHERLHQRL
jgi:glycosyltransferase involved in cell wall biosynthesis